MLPLLVAVGVGALAPGSRPRARSTLATARLALQSALAPGVLIFAERFAIGLFIVPFSLLSHARGVEDAMVGRLYAAFLVPFALATAIVPRTGVAPAAAVVTGGLAYAASLVGIGRVDAVPLLSLVLVAGGLGAAFVYAPALAVAARRAPEGHRGAAMAFLNALGALGMLAGSAGAGALSRALVAGGSDKVDAWRTCFDVGAVGVVVLVAAAAIPFARAARIDDDNDGDDDDDEDGEEDVSDGASPPAPNAEAQPK
jgi:hypothetical protein